MARTKSNAKAAPARASTSQATASTDADQTTRKVTWPQSEELYQVMALLYAATKIMDEKQDDEGMYVWRLLEDALARCEQIQQALMSITVEVANG